MAKPVTAKKSHVCAACGGQIIAGVTKVMLRYAHGDWVHNRPSCLYSQR